MKTTITVIATLLLGYTSMGQSEKKVTETFKVYGNCGMCEKKIEGAVSEKEGVYKADWDLKSKKMKIVFDPKKTNLDKLKQIIADAGYDSKTHRATKKSYEALHGCCQYERPE